MHVFVNRLCKEHVFVLIYKIMQKLSVILNESKRSRPHRIEPATSALMSGAITTWLWLKIF